MRIPYGLTVAITLSVLCLSVIGAAAQGAFDLSLMNVFQGGIICPWANDCAL